MTFIELCIKGDAREEDISMFIEAWHEGRAGTNVELHDYLGMTWSEYQCWSVSPSVLPHVLNAHKLGTSLDYQLAQHGGENR
jgi:hypothetical protein